VSRLLTILLLLTAATASTQNQGSQPLKRVVAAFQKGDPGLRIVGGQAVSIVSHPWQVALLAASIPNSEHAQFCGGSMVAARWVVTAAHCVDGGTSPAQVDVLSGTSSLPCGNRVKVKSIAVHPSWNTQSHDFDIAVLELQKDLDGLPIVGVTAADETSHLGPGSQVTVSGWGALAFGNPGGTTQLQAVTVPFVSRDTCNRPVSYSGKVTENMICAGRAQGGQDSCQGDSGGPATTIVGSERRLAGVVSWGEGCGFPQKYGVYTRVSRFGDWVRETTGGTVKW
jgi:secreted trypsin-like serine protease